MKEQRQRKIRQIVKILNAKYAEDFHGWVRDNIDFSGLDFDDLTWQQIEIGNAIIHDKNVCVAGGGGIGKTAVAALLILWFLSSFLDAKIPTTAPSGKLLDDILWSEISTWLNRCKLKHLFELKSGKLQIKEFKEWYAVARTVPRDGKQLNDTLAGFHAPNLLIMVDESSGVPNPVFTALDGAMTKENARILLISNPVSTGGYYYDTISDPKGKGKGFKVLFFDARESPLVSKTYEERIIARYGQDSPMYKAKVLGLPIDLEDTLLISPRQFDDLIARNKDRAYGRVVLGVDVAGRGTDMSVICNRHGQSIVAWDEFNTNDTVLLKNSIYRIIESRYKNYDVVVVVDGVGIGSGLCDLLESERRYKIIRFIGSEKAHDTNMYDRKRTEGYYTLKKVIMDTHFPVKPPERLKKELVNIKFNYDKGPISMQAKEKLIDILGFSPDYADALMLSSVVDNFSVGSVGLFMPQSINNRLSKILVTQKQANRFGKYSRFLQ